MFFRFGYNEGGGGEVEKWGRGKEVGGKSTNTHICILCPSHRGIEEYVSPEHDVMIIEICSIFHVFPSTHAKKR